MNLEGLLLHSKSEGRLKKLPTLNDTTIKMILEDRLINIVKDYISEKRNGHKIDEANYKKRLKRLKFNDDQIDQIIIEIRDDCERELLAGQGVNRAKRGLVLSIIVCLTLAVITIVSALGLVFQGHYFVVFYGGIASSILYGIKCYYEITGFKQRMKRRELKWKKW